MQSRFASKMTDKSTWLALLLGGAMAALAAQSCSVDKSKYTFIPDDEFTNAGNANPSGGESNGGGAHGGGSNAGSGNPNAGDVSSAGDTSQGCTVGEFNCSDDGHLQTCKAGSPPAFDVGQACGDGKCSASRGACLKCAPGAFQCASNVLQQCDIFGSAFEDAATCDSKVACVADGQKGYCVRCKAGSSGCEPTSVLELNAVNQDSASSYYANTHLVTCNLEGSGTDTAQTCLAESPVCDATSKKCLSCTPNALFCDGSQLNMCSADGNDWTTKSNCNSGTVCDASAGKCVPQAGCTIGAFQCTGASLQACNAAGTFDQIDRCDTAAACDANSGRCQKCQTNNYTCINDTVQACDFNQGEYTPYTAQVCTPGSCVTSQNSANCSMCRPGTVYCYDGSPGYSQCTAGSNLVPVQCLKDVNNVQTVCSSVLGKCVACVPGRATCGQNGVLQVCKPDGSGYSTENCQDNNQQCDAGRAQCVDAEPGRYYCTSDGDLMRVGFDSKHALNATLVQSCGSQNQCDPYDGTCRPNRCVIGQTTCSGADVYSCPTGDRRVRTGTRCGSASRCVDGYGCVKALALAAGDAHTCAVVGASDAVEGDPGYVMCWGANESGQLGDGSPLLADSKEARLVLVGPSNSPGGGPPSPRLLNYFDSVCAGKNFSCAALDVPDSGGTPFVACWGSNAKGQIGVGISDAGPFNGPFSGVTNDPKDDKGLPLHGLTCGSEFACALGADGAAWCWGANESGQLGTGTAGDPATAPAMIAGGMFTQITAGAHHVCAVKTDGTVWCWGANDSGQLGTGTKKSVAVPTLVGKVAAVADRPLALGNDFTLALGTKASKTPFAWGANTFGQLANETTVDGVAPGALSGLLTADLVAGGSLYSGSTAEHACARLGDRLFCWGANVFGEVGDGSTDDRASPLQIFAAKTDTTKLAPGAHSVAVGGRHTCAITAKGDVMCWGANHRYQLGSAAVTPQRVPLKAF